MEVTDDAVKIEGEGSEPDAILAMTDMTEAKLVLTDKLIAESFRRSKQELRAATKAPTKSQKNRKPKRRAIITAKEIPTPHKRFTPPQ